ncbi:MAG TPA: ATP-binding protein [Pyrinomonadaceae bacterium]|jgi:PAS domain S-box-containing protein|nr:ATP-binding protein [Pyrinomonadaceae bacterium]
MRYRSRSNLVLALLVGVFLLANVFAVTMLAVAARGQATRSSLLVVVVVTMLVAGLICIVLLLRWLLRPYRQLVGEAERAPVAIASSNARNEAEFVLETFQSIVARLQAQQRELEALSAQARARAVSAEKFSERIIASVPSGLIAFDADGQATVVNAPAQALVEADGDATGQPVRRVLHHAPALAEMVEHCLTTGELYRREEVESSTSNGRKRRLGATVAPIDLEGKESRRGVLCLLTDITEVTELREQVALKRNLESLGEMAAGLSHEFKNALATLHGYAQLIQSHSQDERGRVASAALLEEVRSLTDTVTAFLNFARPQPLQLFDVSLLELIRECATELQPLFIEHHVEMAIDGEFPAIDADERMLRQALLNLMRNAAESIGEEKAERNVTVRGAREKDSAEREWAVVEILDTGSGINENDLHRIFIPFFTTKSKGHGIGLALAHRVVTEHGGTLTASNLTEGGALFTLRLPL